jgi:hypothetical protein
MIVKKLKKIVTGRDKSGSKWERDYERTDIKKEIPRGTEMRRGNTWDKDGYIARMRSIHRKEQTWKNERIYLKGYKEREAMVEKRIRLRQKEQI